MLVAFLVPVGYLLSSDGAGTHASIIACLQGRAGRRLRTNILFADLNVTCLVSVSDTRISSSLQVTDNHLGQIAYDLRNIGTIADFTLRSWARWVNAFA